MGDEKMCQRFREMLDAYIDDELNKEEIAFMKAHAEKCADCAEELRLSDIIKNDVKGMDDDIVVPLEAQAAWRSAVRKEIGKKKFRRAYKALTSVAAALVVLIGATFAMRSTGMLPPRAVEETPKTAETRMMLTSVSPDSDQSFHAPDTMVQMRSVNTASGFVLETDGQTESLILTEDESENIIKSADIILNTESMEEDIRLIYDLTEEYEGYVSEDVRDFTSTAEHADIVSRIPVDLMDDYISAAENIASVVSVSKYSQNADEIYYDIDSRLESKRALAEELNALITTADEERLITLNEEINVVYEEIDTLTRLANTRDNDLMYAKVKITLNGTAPEPVTPAESTLKDRSSKGFMQSLTAIGDFLQDMVVSVAVIAPVVLLLAAVTLIVLFAAKSVKKKKKTEKEDGEE